MLYYKEGAKMKKFNHYFAFNDYCGAHVCADCGLHAHIGEDGVIVQRLARCYCGWSETSLCGGRRELIEMGETIE